MENVLFERYGLQVCLDSTVLYLSSVRNSLPSALERLLYLGCSAPTRLQRKSLPSSLVSFFVNGIACCESGEIAAHLANLRAEAASVSVSL